MSSSKKKKVNFILLFSWLSVFLLSSERDYFIQYLKAFPQKHFFSFFKSFSTCPFKPCRFCLYFSFLLFHVKLLILRDWDFYKRKEGSSLQANDLCEKKKMHVFARWKFFKGVTHWAAMVHTDHGIIAVGAVGKSELTL